MITNYEYEFIMRLQKISKLLHKMDEREANGLTEAQLERQSKKWAELMDEAEQTAQLGFNMKVFHQTDCRGVALYLVPNDYDESKHNYNQVGVALW